MRLSRMLDRLPSLRFMESTSCMCGELNEVTALLDSLLSFGLVTFMFPHVSKLLPRQVVGV